MLQKPVPDAAGAAGEVDYRLLVPVLINSTLIHAVVSILRVTTSYRAVELDLPIVWLGVISATFAIFPIFLAVWVGRFIDRGNDAVTAWIGSGLIAVAAAGFAMFSSALALLVFMSVLGTGHLFMMAAQQMLCVRSGGPAAMDRVFGNYMVAAAVGQGGGPLVVGWLGGQAALPPTGLLFTICLVVAAVSLIVALAIRQARGEAIAGRKHDPVPIGTLLHMRGLPAIFVASIVTVTAIDLMVIYLPALGTERGIDSNHVGLLLAVRSAASLISRLFYARMIYSFGRAPLTLGSMLVSAAAFVVLALPLSLPLMYTVMVLLGFGMGIASTLTLSGVVHLAPAEAYGTALTLRMTGNRIGQVLFPALAGVVAAATGVAGIFLIIGLGMGVSGVAVPLSLRAAGGDET